MALPVHPFLLKIEVTQDQYDALKAEAEQARTFDSPTRVQSTLLGIPVIVVDEDIPRPVMVFSDGSRS